MHLLQWPQNLETLSWEPASWECAQPGFMEAVSRIYRAPILKWLQALHDGKCTEDYRVGAIPQRLTVHKYLLLMKEDIKSENQVCGLG